MDDITLGELCRNMTNFIEQNNNDHKKILDLLDGWEKRTVEVEKTLTQIKPIIAILMLVVVGVAIPLLYKFFEIKMFGR